MTIMGDANKDRVLYVCGPTASGKSDLAFDIARAVGGEIVGADSMQIYRGFDISTAKPSPEQMAVIPHHLISFLEPTEEYNVSRYAADAKRTISDILSRGSTPVVCGGTGLYIDSIINNTDFFEEPDNTEIRAELNAELAEKGPGSMFEALRAVDPAAAEKIDPANTRRVIRALEVFRLTGETFSSRIARSRSEGSCWNNTVILLGFNDRDILYKRIERRVDNMIRMGLVNEAAYWYDNKGVLSSTALQAIGCKEFNDLFEKTKTLDECADALKRDTRHYAKRQITWFERYKTADRFFVDEYRDPADLSRAVTDHLKEGKLI